MLINPDRCVGCTRCFSYCPVGAISKQDKKAVIDLDACLECRICFRSNICPVNAFELEELSWPRTLRAAFSDVLNPHKSTGVLGRGTEEMKTNDVTGRLKLNTVGVSIELGRPGIGTDFLDVQTISQAIAPLNVHFEEENPVTSLMTDQKTGSLQPEVLNERVLSALVEFTIPTERLPEILEVIKKIEKKVRTVFSLCISTPLAPGQEGNPFSDILKELQLTPRLNGKTNIGLGKPFKEVSK